MTTLLGRKRRPLAAINTSDEAYRNVSVKIINTHFDRAYFVPPRPIHLGDLESGFTELEIPSLAQGRYGFDIITPKGVIGETLDVSKDANGNIKPTISFSRLSDGKTISIP